MKSVCITLGLLFITFSVCVAQQRNDTAGKVQKTVEKINRKTQQISEASNRVKEQAGYVAANTQNVITNAKAVIKVFQPIFQHFKKKRNNTGNAGDVVVNAQVKSDENNGSNGAPGEQNEYPAEASRQYGQEGYGNPSANSGAGEGNQYYPYPGTPENQNYNSDGSANWGNQYNAEYGNYLDAFTGTILDGGTAEDAPNSVDLIFLAPNDGQNAYYLITPNFAHDNGSADAFWGSATTDNPVKAWHTVNESEVAVTTLTGMQFEKIQYNEQLRGAVKQAKGFASFYSSTSKLDGKVFAVKTNMAGRDAYALIYVVKHVGTSGSGGYLKVKIKCTGLDNTGDGNPDAALYIR